jgi:diacylglycerol kinase family enzyme
MNSHYAYIYDDFLSDRGFERDVAALETKLNRYDLAGRIGRLALFRNPQDLVEGLVKQGATTIVIVGNDTTLDKTMWFLPDLNVTVGYIPLVAPSMIAGFLGIPVGVDACDILSARLVETIDMGKLDDRYFLTEISVPASLATLEIEGRYKVSPVNGGSLTIRNLGGMIGSRMVQADDKDGFLEAVIIPQEAERKRLFWKTISSDSKTHILFNHGKIASKSPLEAKVDHHAVSGFKFDVSIVPKKLKMITGRGRRPTLDEEVLPTRRKNGNFGTASEGGGKRKK